MATAAEWVRQIVTKSTEEPMSTEEVLKSLERFAGQGDRSVQRVRDVLDHIDRELVERRGGVVMRTLWATVADYQEKVLENSAAA